MAVMREPPGALICFKKLLADCHRIELARELKFNTSMGKCK
jgi:hypothetical protein